MSKARLPTKSMLKGEEGRRPTSRPPADGTLNLVVDPRGRLKACEPRLAELLGANGSARTLHELLGVAALPSELGRALKVARQGRGCRVEVPLKRVDGKLRVEFEVEPHAAGACLVLERLVPGEPGVRPTVYEVQLAGREFGRLRAIGTLRGRVPAHGVRCHEHFAASPEPCAGCPALALKEQPNTKRVSGVIVSGTLPLWVAHAERKDSHVCRVVSVPLAEESVGELFQARVSHLAARSGLSDRERSVFDLVLLGRSFEQIGSVLRITPRTVRFHLGNILAKVGADSRADLFRVLL